MLQKDMVSLRLQSTVLALMKRKTSTDSRTTHPASKVFKKYHQRRGKRRRIRRAAIGEHWRAKSFNSAIRCSNWIEMNKPNSKSQSWTRSCKSRHFWNRPSPKRRDRQTIADSLFQAHQHLGRSVVMMRFRSKVDSQMSNKLLRTNRWVWMIKTLFKTVKVIKWVSRMKQALSRLWMPPGGTTKMDKRPRKWLSKLLSKIQMATCRIESLINFHF